MAYGQTILGTTGQQLSVLASDPSNTRRKVGGCTLDWATVTAVSADTTLPDGTVVTNGLKYLRYGQILARANVAEVQTVEFTGGPTTGGTILALPALGDIPGGNTTSISATATAAAFEAALLVVYDDAPVVSVTRAGAGSAGSPYIYTVTFNRKYGNVDPITSVSNTFGGGTTPSVTIATGTAGAGTGLYGPYDPNASDGRQTLTRGECFILPETLLQTSPFGFNIGNADQASGVFDGGTVWKARMLITSGTHTLVDGPTVAEFETAFPAVDYALY